MNGQELLERWLCRGVPLWRIEDELDWQENAANARQSALLPQARGPTAMGRASWRPLLFLFGWFFGKSGNRDTIRVIHKADLTR